MKAAIMKLKGVDFKIIWSTLERYGGQILMAGISVLVVKMLTNFFSESLYSEYRRIIEYVTFFYIAANLGLEVNLVRHMADNPEDGKVFTNALMLRMISAGIVFLVAVLIMVLFVGEEIFLVAGMAYLAVFFLEFVTTICRAMLQAHYLMGRAMAAIVGGKVLVAGVTFLMVLDFGNGGLIERLGFATNGFRLSPGNWNYLSAGSWDIPLLYLAPLIGAFVTMGACLFFVRQKLEFKWKMDWGLWKELLWTGLPFGIVNVINNIYFRAAPHYLANEVLSSSGMAEQFGNFNLQFRITFMLSLFSTALMMSVMPALKHSLTEKDFRRARDLLKKSSYLLFAIGVLLVGGVSWLGPWFIENLANKSLVSEELWFVFPMFLTLAAVSYFYDLVLISLYTLDQEWWFLKREILALGVAGVVFGGVWILDSGAFSGFFGETLGEVSVQVKVALCVLGAIVGEGVIVGLGLRRLKKLIKVS